MTETRGFALGRRIISPHSAVAAVVLLASTLLALTHSRTLSLRVIMLLLGVGMAVLLVRQPPIGLAGLVIASLLVPYAVGTGTYTSIGANLLLLGAMTVVWLLRSWVGWDERALPRSSTIPPLLALCIVAVLAFGVGQLPWSAFAQTAPFPAQLGGLFTYLISAAAFILAATQIRTVDWLSRITWLFLVVGFVIVLNELVGDPFRLAHEFVTRGAKGSLLWTWLVAMAIAQGLFNKQIGRGFRIALIGLAIAIFYRNFFLAARWSSGWIPPLVAVILILWISLPKLGAAVSLAGVAAAVATPERISGILLTGDNQYSLITRLEAWRIVGEIVKANPLLGLGPANYNLYVPLIPILGYSVRFSSHNNFVDIVAQIGLLGLLCFIWFVVAIARVAWGLLKKLPEGFARAYVIGALGGLAGTLVAGMLGDWVIPFVYNVGLDGMRASLLGWLFLGGVVALQQMTKRGELELVGEAAA